MSGQRKEVVLAALAVLILYAFFYATGIGCPIRFVTGISCAGCGMTRAWMEAIRLNFQEAFRYHPLFWTVPPAVMAWACRRHIGKKTFIVITAILIAAFIAVYIIRMLDDGNGIVAFEPWNSVPAKIIRTVSY